jgi:hypothetical protein
MDSIKVDLKYCYGIGKLEKEFDLRTSNGCVIYSQNGTMKTSFANTFDDIANGRDTIDRIYPNRETKRVIYKDSNLEIEPDEILVIKPYDDTLRFSKYKDTSLLVNEELRQKYLKVYNDIDEKKKILLKKLSKRSGIKKDIEKYITETFDKEFYQIIEEVESVLKNFNTDKYEHLPSYKKVFDEKGINDLKSSVEMSQLNEYMEKYNELLEKSLYLKKGIFNHTNAINVGKVLDTNGFFQAEHSVNLNADDGALNISSKEELEEVINKEKERVLNDKSLRELFEKIDQALIKNKNTEGIKKLLEENPDIVEEYNNIENFKKNMWYTYFKLEEDTFNELLEIYYSGKKDIEKIIEEAKNQETEWHNVLKIFKRRFFVPFDMEIKNKTDVLLGEDTPTIEFFYEERDSENKQKIDETLLMKCLSIGEKRAFYLLNIIFQIKRKEKIGKKVLLIIDDIAYSFDYKNKYAIIEYLNDIKKTDIFKMIILTHNFDFYRTVATRLNFNRNNVYMTVKIDETIKIVKGQYTRNLFRSWKNELQNDNRKLIASIPFTRNIVEYLEDTSNGKSDDHKFLTKLLHIKDGSENITVKKLEEVFNSVYKEIKEFENKERKVFDIIFEEAEKIFNETHEDVKLENKLVLSIASRLYAEKFVISKLEKVNGTIEFEGNQTPKLIEEYKKYYPSNEKEISLLEQINMMTVENIHVNSFMYEPIIDLTDYYLKDIYECAKELCINECKTAEKLVAIASD